jgi:hypothetical protein
MKYWVPSWYLALFQRGVRGMYYPEYRANKYFSRYYHHGNGN